MRIHFDLKIVKVFIFSLVRSEIWIPQLHFKTKPYLQFDTLLYVCRQSYHKYQMLFLTLEFHIFISLDCWVEDRNKGRKKNIQHFRHFSFCLSVLLSGLCITIFAVVVSMTLCPLCISTKHSFSDSFWLRITFHPAHQNTIECNILWITFQTEQIFVISFVVFFVFVLFFPHFPLTRAFIFGICFALFLLQWYFCVWCRYL